MANSKNPPKAFFPTSTTRVWGEMHSTDARMICFQQKGHDQMDISVLHTAVGGKRSLWDSWVIDLKPTSISWSNLLINLAFALLPVHKDTFIWVRSRNCVVSWPDPYVPAIQNHIIRTWHYQMLQYTHKIFGGNFLSSTYTNNKCPIASPCGWELACLVNSNVISAWALFIAFVLHTISCKTAWY